ncbi:MAG TPA: pitrilysin family protein [Hyphomicrobiaceae bacterium]|nr:pitrilysin family protein [Hyphomicrobiaceae bacterium]
MIAAARLRLAARWLAPALRASAAAAVVAGALLLLALPGPARAAEIREVKSPGGITAWLVEEKSLPIIAIRFAFDGGAAQEAAGKEGTAGLLAAMLDQGAGDLSAAAFQTQAEKLAVRISFDSDRDTFFGNFETLTKNLAKASELLKLAVTAPRLEQSTLERTRAQLAARASFEAGDANKVANAQWMAQSFPGHPYARAIAGTPDSLKAITREDLDGFRKRIMARRTLRVAAVGDIDGPTLGRVLDEVFGGLPAEPRLTPVADVAPKAAPKPTVVNLEGPQSVAIFGRRGIERSHPDYYPGLVLSQLVGGGSSDARLVREVREKRGLSYWIYTLLYNFKHSNMLIGGFASPNKDVATSLELVRAEFRELAEKGPTDEEVEAAKSYLIGSFVLSLDSNAKIAEQMLRAQLQGLGRDFVNERKASLAKVTRADVARVARSLLTADELSVAIAGQPDGIGR